MANKITTTSTADAYVLATANLKAAEAGRSRRPSDEIAAQDDRDIAYFEAAIARQAAHEAYEASAPDVPTLRGFLVKALKSAQAELELCEQAAAPIAPPPANRPITAEALEALAEMFAERAARVAALEARRLRAQSRIASDLAAFRILQDVAQAQRAAAGLPRLPTVLPSQSIFGQQLAFPDPQTAQVAATILEIVIAAAKPKPANGSSTYEIDLQAAQQSRAARLVREQRAREVMRRGRSEPVAAPSPGFVSR